MSNNETITSGMAAKQPNQHQSKTSASSFVLTYEACLTEQRIAELRLLVDQQGHSANVEANTRANVKANARDVRRSRICFLSDAQQYKWAYDIVWEVANKANEQFHFDLTPLREPMQVAAYDSSEQGFYDWHPDIGLAFMWRKLSISIPLSAPSEYSGGEFQIMTGGTTHQTIPQSKGCPIVFPSFIWHRVTQVTQGKRYSLVAWIGGPNWR